MPHSYTKKNGSSFKPDPSRFLFNVDTLYYSCLPKNYDQVMNDWLLQELSEGRELAEKFTESKRTISLKLPKYENELLFEIEGKGKTAYSYQIRNQDFAFYFARRSDNDNYPIFVHINQFKLWQLGVIEAYMESLEIIALLGFVIETCKPSRIDLCCHTDQFQFTITDLQKHFKTPPNTKKNGLWGVDFDSLSFETVAFGNRSNYQIRIYNKSSELMVKQKYHFLQVYEEYGLTNNVWNIEFELSRKFLKNIEVNGEKNFFDDMDNLLSEKGLSILWTELTTNKFKMLKSKEKADSPLLPLWKVLASGNKGKNGKSVFFQTNEYMSRVKEIDDSLPRELKQITGRYKKFAKNEPIPEGVEPLNFAMTRYYKMILEEHPELIKKFAEEVKKEQSLYVDQDINKLIKKEPQTTPNS
ncbi:hypothetical protein [Bacillus vallismortis]|uniref:hypothetical protein n=1 Tax=Bacillus vallismortis TaxID=72361 RepID=UPI002282B0B3|nr:hypothetical protein [Bacillus vallismortis]MCY8546429.1 hypothetical protein [Bacillus vallismortis]